MNPKTLNIIRIFLLIMVFVLLALTGVLYSQKGTFNFSTFVVATGCLLVYVVTGKKKT